MESTTSAVAASARRSRMSSKRSRTIGRTTGSPLASETAAARAYALLFTTWPGPGVSSTSTSSAPVERIATRGRRCTTTVARPTDASTPTSAGPMTAPASRTTAPGSMSSPARRTLAPGRTGTWMVTMPSRSSVSSTRTTVSAPSGTTDPVKILAAVPGSTGTASNVPAGALPISRSRAGAVRTSSPRTANPSIAELAAAGTARAATTSSPATRPAAVPSSSRSVPSTGVASSTARRASPTEITAER